MISYQKHKIEKAGRIVNIVFNVIFIPLFIFVLIIAFSVLITRLQSGVPSVFGYTQVEIASASMESAGFDVGSKCFVKSENPQNLAEGDIIAFFQFADPNCSVPGMVTEYNYPRAKADSSKIVFHQIIMVETDVNGNKWFTTKGVDNAEQDRVKIYQNYVIGKYLEEEDFWSKLITFVSSPTGLICLIVVPCSLIVASDIYQIIILSYNLRNSKYEGDDW